MRLITLKDINVSDMLCENYGVKFGRIHKNLPIFYPKSRLVEYLYLWVLE